MEYKISYPVYVWLTTALLGALLYFISIYVANYSGNTFNLSEIVIVYLLTVAVGTLASLPALVLLLFSVHFLSRISSSYLKLKIKLSLIAIIICIGIFLCFGPYYFLKAAWPIMLAYIIPLVASIFFYEVNGKDNDYSNQLADPS
ncbi:hypothetical protein [Pedobacter frigiditerrae]|uniref:hypothetical protein n=1 Tax=Pedobacter frigiditerrae TaxID=2530452 RepID=UPI00293079C7|nr:hypothetical protein [Pedobacter frigiditerrae]